MDGNEHTDGNSNSHTLTDTDADGVRRVLWGEWRIGLLRNLYPDVHADGYQHTDGNGDTGRRDADEHAAASGHGDDDTGRLLQRERRSTCDVHGNIDAHCNAAAYRDGYADGDTLGHADAIANTYSDTDGGT